MPLPLQPFIGGSFCGWPLLCRRGGGFAPAGDKRIKVVQSVAALLGAVHGGLQLQRIGLAAHSDVAALAGERDQTVLDSLYDDSLGRLVVAEDKYA